MLETDHQFASYFIASVNQVDRQGQLRPLRKN